MKIAPDTGCLIVCNHIKNYDFSKTKGWMQNWNMLFSKIMSMRKWFYEDKKWF